MYGNHERVKKDDDRYSNLHNHGKKKLESENGRIFFPSFTQLEFFFRSHFEFFFCPGVGAIPTRRKRRKMIQIGSDDDLELRYRLTVIEIL